MLVVISPAKKLDENCDTDVISKFTVPPYLESSKKIIKSLREYQLGVVFVQINHLKFGLLDFEFQVKGLVVINQ